MNHAALESILTTRHSTLFVVTGIGTLFAAALIGAGTTMIHMMLLVLLLPISGIPHGALDYHIGLRTFKGRLGRWWSAWFVTIYLIIMSMVIAVWMAKPVWSLSAFLLLTIYHFGTGDAIPIPQTPKVIRITEIIARGGMVITFPAFAARPDVNELFSYLVPKPGAVILAGGLANLAPLVSLCVLLTVAWGLIEFARFHKPVSIGRGIELLVIALIFIKLPPLLAFTIYFSFMHSLRHMLAVADRKPAGTLFTYLVDTFRMALPVTIATMIIGAAAYLLISGTAFDMPQLMKVVFIGIASMTYPHVVVVDVAKRLGIISDVRRSECVRPETRFANARNGVCE